MTQPMMTATLEPEHHTAGAGELDNGRTAARAGGPATRRRRIRMSVAGLALAGVLLGVGSMMASDANFGRGYVGDQLAQQKITFKSAEALTAEERKSECLVKNAGKAMTTGEQAECYANDFIGLHVRTMGKGRSYAHVSEAQRALRADVTAAQAEGGAAPELEKELAELTRLRQQMFEGESLRGMLLSSYGFNVLADKAALAATAAYVAAGLVALLLLAGLIYTVARRDLP